MNGFFRSPALACLVLASLVLVVSVTPASAQEARTVSGSATYLQRMALPEDAALVVEATGFRGTPLAMSHSPTEGRQVPLPFSLSLPQGVAADLQVAITSAKG